jgi:Helix-turn-helix domain
VRRALACGVPTPDPIPDLKRQAGAELARLVARWNGDDIGVLLRTDRARVADLRRGKLDRFSLETLIRFLTRLGTHIEMRIAPAPLTRRSARIPSSSGRE